ncbi:MAG: UDP-glucose/GDP-mannose dehydrogenase family protein [Alphaproteobacteria bacterium]|nr:UDP-glucose/GDP-mannose dehydrogenase family protein [Alphaproteobacteria bacterium]
MANVSVFGLGKVGHTLAACLGASGHTVVCYDVNPKLVAAINDRSLVSCEVGVAERIGGLGPDRLRATTSAAEAIRASDATFVIVPTPSNMLGGFSLRYVLDACRTIGGAIKQKKTPHAVSLVSTVLPGSSDRFIVPALEHASGRRIGGGLHYCYNPAFIALGEVVRGFERPDYVLIGECEPDGGELIAAIHLMMVRNQATIVRMKAVEAEITKIASNTHETMRVAFANMLLSLCNEMPNADVDRITGALAHRIGKRFFKGAMPYGGPCWPRDNRALAVLVEALGGTSALLRAVDDSNAEHGAYVFRNLLNLSRPGDTVGIIGLAYKPGTPVIEKSYSVELARWLAAEGRSVIGWDPLAMDETRQVLSDTIAYASSAEQVLTQSDISVVAMPLPELSAVDWGAAGDKMVVDCWRCVPQAAQSKLKHYRALGHGEDAALGPWIAERMGNRFDVLCN